MEEFGRPFDDPDDIPVSWVAKHLPRDGSQAVRSPRGPMPSPAHDVPEMGPVTGPSPYSELLQEQLAEERSRKKSLEQRGFSTMSVSGFLASLLFGATGLIRSSTGSLELSLPVKIAIGVALASLLGAAVCGTLANRVRRYQELSPEALPELYRRLADDYSVAERRVFRFRSNLLWSTRLNNDFKARWVKLALNLQVVAAAAVIYAALDLVLTA